MTNADKNRLDKLDTNWTLVYKGTGEVVGYSYPGGAPVIDDNVYKWTGTEVEWSEYKSLYFEDIKERSESTANAFLKSLIGAVYGRPHECQDNNAHYDVSAWLPISKKGE